MHSVNVGLLLTWRLVLAQRCSNVASAAFVECIASSDNEIVMGSNRKIRAEQVGRSDQRSANPAARKIEPILA